MARPGGLADAWAGHKHPTHELVTTRLGRRIYVGFKGGGYVALRAGEARQLAAALLALAGEQAPT